MELAWLKINAARTNKHIGKRFGRLTVIGTAEPYIHKSGRSETVSVVRCDCGNIKHVRNCSLTSGLTLSCGCLKRETAIANNKKLAVTGMSHSRIYNIFRSMHARCENVNHVGYKNYGGKGISVCDEWRDFKPFYEWAVANGYGDNLTIDRINSSLGYSPFNCRFITIADQERNKPSVRMFNFDGAMLTIPQISDKVGISESCLRRRIKSGVPEEIAFSAKPSNGNCFKRGIYKCA